MKTVYFLIQGQFGNNMFQYFAAEILKKIYGYEETKPTFQINLEFNTVIDDEKFKLITTCYMNGEKYELDTRRDILLMGFFQRSEIFKYEYKYIRSLFTLNNSSHISNRIRIDNIVKYKTNHLAEPTDSDLTLHLRCGDFWDHEKNRSQIYHPDTLKNIIKHINYDKLYIVATTAEFEWEKEYYSQFNELNPVWISGNLGDDFDFIIKSKKVITSASTMSWMGAFLGNADEIHIPYNSFYGGFEGFNQSLADFNNSCKVYYDIEYWFPSKTQ